MSRLGRILIFAFKTVFASLAIGYIFYRYVDVSHLWTDLTHAHLVWLSGAVLMHILIRISQAYQTMINVNYYGMGFSLFDITKFQLISSFYAFVLPGDIAGGGVTWRLLSRDNGLRAQAASSIVFLRLLNLSAFVPFAALGFLIEPALEKSGLGIYLLFVTVFLAIFMLPFISHTMGSFVEAIGSRFILALPWKRIHEAYANFWYSVKLISDMPGKLIFSIIWQAVLAQCLAVVLFYCCALSVGLNVPFSVFLWIRAIVAIIQLLPITIGGLGLREFTFIVLLQKLYHVEPVQATSFSLTVFITTFLLGGIAGAYFVVFDKRKKLTETKAA